MALEILGNDNYASWSACIRNYLLAHDLWDIVEATIERPKPEDDIIQYEDWKIKNGAALDAIHALCGIDILAQIRGISSSKIVWDTLAKLYGQLPQGVNTVTGLGNSASVSVSKESVTPMLTGAIQLVEQGNPSNVTGVGNSANVSESKEAVTPMPIGAIQQVEQGNSSNHPGRDNAGSHDHAMYAALLKAVQSGNLKAVQDFLKLHPEATGAKVTWTNETALHIAVFAEKTHIIEELVKVMSPEDLAIRDRYGYTALARAAASEDYRMAECMIRKNPMLVSIPHQNGPRGYIPVVSATNLGNEEMARYLYSCTPLQYLEPEKSRNGASLVSEALLAGYYDIALDLIERCPRLARARDRYNRSPLYALTSMPKAFPSGNRLMYWKQWIYDYCIHIDSGRATKDVRLHIIPNDQEGGRVGSVGALPCQLLASNLLNFFGFKQLHDMKLRHVQSHQLLHRMCEEISTLNHEDMLGCSIYEAFFRAAKKGIFEIVLEGMRRNPILLQVSDADGRNIFMHAVLNRQAEIFSLVYGLKRKKDVLSGEDKVFGNNILHMAGVLTASTPLNHIPGAALQMQRELQWFKEVESIVSPAFKIMLNDNDLTPKQLFTLNHEDLRKMGEKWMQSTATSCTVVGSLIITIMFAVAFTVPGGNDQTTGFPIFASEKLFILFMIFDSISLFSSSASVLMFLGVLTSRYAEEDFLESLPKKLIIGLCTLFFSIATMMITFSFALFLILRGRSWIAIPIISLASIPVTLFVLMQFPLLVDMLKSTYGSGIFNRNMKSWL